MKKIGGAILMLVKEYKKLKNKEILNERY